MQLIQPPDSLWRAEARPAPAAQPLAGDLTVDLAIIGAGYTGLAAGLRALELGRSVAVLDAGDVGAGASGRNGGVVSTKFRASLSDIARQHGAEMARRMHRIGHDAVDAVEELVARYGIEAGFAITGNLRCAHNLRALAGLRAEMQVTRDLFKDSTTRAVEREEVRAETGSAAFVGGVLVQHAGLIEPLNYVRGLAAAFRAQGGVLHEQSPVAWIERGGPTRLVTPGGLVTARQIVIATNGYSDLTQAPGVLRRCVIPFRSAMVATAPIPPALRADLMVQGRGYSETRRMMRWFRPAGERMIFGGRGAFGRSDSEAAFAALEAALVRLFPQLEGIAVTHRWSGLVAMTMNSLPQVGKMDETTGFALGYNGAGIAMASLMGRRIAEIMAGRAPDLGLIGSAGPSPVPFHALRSPAVRAVAGWYQLLDRIGA